jgi:ATP-dependent Lon protease
MPAGSRVVLIVDDEPLIRWAVAQTLHDRGCETVDVADARSATALLVDGRYHFDAIILDYHLPDAHDLVLLADARRLSPTSRLVMLTASLTPELSDRALALGAVRVLPKPVDLDLLARIVLGFA